jgi:CRP/FNR family transcriptional regulator
MDKKTILSRIPLFEDISSENLAGMADIARLRNIRKKEILFLEGQEGSSLFILVSGAVQLYKSTSEGREIVIKVVRPVDMFAEVILFEQDEYPVNAVALTDSEIITVPRTRFIGLLENERFRNEFIGSLMRKLRYLTDHIKYLTHHDVEGRFLLFLKEQFGKAERVDVDMSKKDVAAAIGTTPETLSRLLFRLKGEGLLTWKGQSIEIDPRAWEIIEEN